MHTTHDAWCKSKGFGFECVAVQIWDAPCAFVMCCDVALVRGASHAHRHIFNPEASVIYLRNAKRCQKTCARRGCNEIDKFSTAGVYSIVLSTTVRL